MYTKLIFKIGSFFLLTGVLFIVPSKLFAQKDLPITVESGVIPPEFNQNNDTILIHTNDVFYAMSIKKHFRKSYTGNFLVVKSLANHSIENCRYVFYEGTSTSTTVTVGGPNNGQSRSRTETSSFYILDRKTKKEYANPNFPTPKLIKSYLSGLDKARQL